MVRIVGTGCKHLTQPVPSYAARWPACATVDAFVQENGKPVKWGPLQRHCGGHGCCGVIDCEGHSLSSKVAWLVRLGEVEWSRFTYARGDDDPLRLLGSVRRGAQVGALAMTAQERYVQVVGDFVSTLPSGEITRAVAKARKLQPHEPYLRPPSAPSTAPVPVVTVKRRRVFVPV